MDFTIEETKKAKGISICLLIFHHLFFNKSLILAHHITSILPIECLTRIAYNARVCVWIFIFLSAYGMAKTYKKKAHFVILRLCKLMRNYWIVLFCAWIICWLMPSRSFSIYAQNYKLFLLCDFLAISDLLHFPMLIGTFWYMSFAILQVLFFPFCYYGCKKMSWSILLVLVIFLQLFPPFIISPYGGEYRMYTIIHFLGILFAQKDVFRWFSRVIMFKCKYYPFFVFLLLVAIILPFLANYYVSADYLCVKQMMMCISSISICLVSFIYIKNKTVNNMLKKLGDYSGKMFMIHSFVYVWFPSLVFWTESVFITWVSCILITFVVSFIVEIIDKKTIYHCFFDKFGNYLIIR